MKGMIPGGFSLGLLLIALGAGYLVCAQASKEKKALKLLGYAIGVFVIVVSGVIVLNKLTWFCGSAKQCPLTGKLMMHQQAVPAPQR